MTVIPVLYEDHSWANFRPLSWSRPTFEIRVGMFCLRERAGHLTVSSEKPGILLGRPALDGLQMATNWHIGQAAAKDAMANDDHSFLWINGRVDWNHERLSTVLAMAASSKRVLIQDDLGILAFSCAGSLSRDILESWGDWQAGVASSGNVVPWAPEIRTGEGPSEASRALKWIWEIVPRTSTLLSEDLLWARAGASWTRQPHGIVPLPGRDKPVWEMETFLKSWAEEAPATLCNSETLLNKSGIWYGPGVEIGPGTAIDATRGPVILDREVTILPNCYLEGPLYIGPGTRVKAGAAIYGESSFGICNRISGEIGESTFGDFANKQHEGFIGHAVLGSWTNLGALTTCSDLKNNYGNVRVDLGSGQVDTGLRFVGLLLGDHAKTAIGTFFNTGTCVGFASNIFGGGMPPKYVRNFSWGGQPESPDYGIEKALETGKVVMSRRGCEMTEQHRHLFETISLQK